MMITNPWINRAAALALLFMMYGVGVSVVFPGFIRDAGMFHESGTKLPKGVGTKTPDDVAAGVVKALESDPPELVKAIERYEAAGIGRLAALEHGRASVAAFRAHKSRMGSDISIGSFLDADMPKRLEAITAKAGK